MVGVLYLENNLTPHVFTPARMAILKLLASEAATSLENTRLYGDLQEREAKIRRLVRKRLMRHVMHGLNGEREKDFCLPREWTKTPKKRSKHISQN